MVETDVFVIGGGPAGLAAAIAARQKGLRVIVADGSHPPIDKACGEGLMPDAITAAARIGIRLPEHAGHRFRGIRFHGEGRQVEADFPNGHGLGFRRTVLHAELAAQAADAGVELRWNTPVIGIEGGRSRWIVGADGLSSRVRRWAGLDRFARNSVRFAYRRHYAVKPWSEFVEIYWGDACQIYVTPVAPAEVTVALISHSHDLRLNSALRRFPILQARLDGAAAIGNERGATTANARLRAVAKDNVALIGDASGSVDAITGEGICLAFHQAAVLAEAMAAGDLSIYAKKHRQLARRPSIMADLMLTMDRWTWVRRRALSIFSARPTGFARMLALHVNAL
jgi:flavin-dependent dehydrogenase